MAVFRVERTKDYTVMSNYHLKDKRLTLKAKGLLSQMLSLPDDWDYTLSGLAKINKESKDAIRTAINELEDAGYVFRRQIVLPNGKFGGNDYTIYERPRPVSPSSAIPLSENPPTVIPTPKVSPSDIPTQLNTHGLNTQKQNTYSPNTQSYLSYPSVQTRRDRIDWNEWEQSKNLIRQSIDYSYLTAYTNLFADEVDELVNIMTEALCSKGAEFVINKIPYSYEVVRHRLLSLRSNHIIYVMDCMRKNKTEVRDIGKYYLTALFNAPMTMNLGSVVEVAHDLNNNR